jgi:hypothetical protein
LSGRIALVNVRHVKQVEAQVQRWRSTPNGQARSSCLALHIGQR